MTAPSACLHAGCHPGRCLYAAVTADRVYLSEREVLALMLDTGWVGKGREVQCAFGGNRAWLDPDLCDEHGAYPQWILQRLAILRGQPVTGVQPPDRAELVAFAAVHGREVMWDATAA